MVPVCGLRAQAAAKRSLVAPMAGSLLSVEGPIGGALLNGDIGAAWGLGLAAWIEATVWWWQYVRSLREAHTSPRDAPLEARPPAARPGETHVQSC